MKHWHKIISLGALLSVMLPFSASARICILGICNDVDEQSVTVRKDDGVKKSDENLPADDAAVDEDKNDKAKDAESAVADKGSDGESEEKISGDEDAVVAAVATDIDCQIGDIYYADDTCSSEVAEGKKPLGVVFDTRFKLVLGLDIPQAGLGGTATRSGELPWCGLGGSSGCGEVDGYTGLRHAIGHPRGGDVTLGSFDLEGKNNTKLLATYSTPYTEGKNFTAKDHPAAQYCYSLKTGGKEWYLPATGEALGIEKNILKINDTLKKLGQKNNTYFDYGDMIIPEGAAYWTSTRGNMSFAMGFFPFGECSDKYKGKHSGRNYPMAEDFDCAATSSNNLSGSGSLVRCIFSYKPEPKLPTEASTVCDVGSIYYDDDTCSNIPVSGKTPIGIVYDKDMRLVLSLKDSLQYWSGHEHIKELGGIHYNDVVGDTVFTGGKGNIGLLEAATDGKYNTDVIAAYAAAHGKAYPAAEYCHDMQTGGKEWYLPAIGEMKNLNINTKDKINVALKAVGEKELSNAFHWSSTQDYWQGYIDAGMDESNHNAWGRNPRNGVYGSNGTYKFNHEKYFVRCVFKY